MNRAPISACVACVLVCGVATMGVAQGKASHKLVRQQVSDEQRISSSEVRIAPTALAAGSTSIDIGGDHWNARGYDLKTLISEIFDVDVRRIDFGGEDVDARYDVTVTLPHDVDEDVMQRLLIGALERKFGLTITPEDRAMDVYVLTAPNGPGAGLRSHTASGDAQSEDSEEIKFLGKRCDGVSSGGIMASAGTLGEFRRTLEPDLDRLLVDETGLKGSYDFQIGTYDGKDQLFKLLHDQLGIVVTQEQRTVTMLAVRPAREMQAKL